MALKLEVGKYYRDAEGARRGPMKFAGGRFFEKGKGMHTDPEWLDDGLNCSVDIWLDDVDEAPNLIAEWTDAPTGPVRTVTRTTREIVPGEYDGLDVGRAVNGMVFLAMPIANHGQESIDALIAHLTVIRDAMEDQ